MTLTKFESIDGYGYVDLDDAPVSVGPTRSARKVLDRTSIDLARHATYTFAIHGIAASGATLALNHDRDGDDPFPEAAFKEASESWRNATKFMSHTGIGMSDAEVANTLAASASVASIDSLTNASAIGSTELAGARVVVTSNADEADEADLLEQIKIEASSVEPIADRGAALRSGADVLFVRGGTGTLDHEVVADTDVGVIVGLQPLSTTARGLAVASRAGAIVIPDFVSAGGPYIAALSEIEARDELLNHVRTQTALVASKYADAGVDSFVRACELAEDFMRTWASELPFGRPLAP